MTKVGANSFIWIKRQKFTCFIVCRITFKGLIIRIFKILSQKQTAPYPNVLLTLVLKVNHSMYFALLDLDSFFSKIYILLFV